MEKEWTQSPPPRFPLKITDIVKNKQLCGKPSAIGLSKYVRINTLSPLLFPGIIRLLFELFNIFLARNKVGSHVKESESKFDISYFIHTIPGQLPVKNFFFQHSPVLRV